LKLFILHPAPGRKDGACGIKHVLGTAKGDFVVPEDFDAPLSLCAEDPQQEAGP
jgi:hypothetical protein